MSVVGLTVMVWLSSAGAGLTLLPQAAFAGFQKVGPAGVLQALDGGVQTQGYYLQATLAAPAVVNVGGVNFSWIANKDGPNYLGVRLGSLNTTVPINCPGSGVALQLDAQAGDYSAKLSKIGGSSDTIAVRVQYECGTSAVAQ